MTACAPAYRRAESAPALSPVPFHAQRELRRRFPQRQAPALDPEPSKTASREPTHINLNDGTLAGFRMTDKPVFAVPHHSEASAGPHDAGYPLDAFVDAISERRARRPGHGGARARGARPDLSLWTQPKPGCHRFSATGLDGDRVHLFACKAGKNW
jgi:hypothetical protein